jgi:hypothetical protein
VVKEADVGSVEALAVLGGALWGLFPPGRLIFPVATAEVVALQAGCPVSFLHPVLGPTAPPRYILPRQPPAAGLPTNGRRALIGYKRMISSARQGDAQ